MANFVRSVKNWFRSIKDKMANGIENPVREGKFNIEDAEKEVIDFRSKIGRYAGTIKQQEKKIQDYKVQVEKWDNISKQAAKKENIEDVKASLSEKNRNEQLLSTSQLEVDKNTEMLVSIKDRYSDLLKLIENAKSDFCQLEVRKESSDIRKSMALANSEVGNSSAFARLDALKKHVIAEECEVDALEEMNDISKPNRSLENKYSTLDKDIEVAATALIEHVRTA